MIRLELARFGCAVQLLTRLPIPALDMCSEDPLAGSARYFPLVGLIVGGLSAAVFALARLAWPTGAAPAVLAVAAAVVVTGAFHEDGLADTADGLGGGQTPEQRLAIMRDSRLGSYGALALGLVLAARVCALVELHAPWLAAGALLSAHGLGRAAAVVTMRALPYAADPASSRLKGSRTVRGLDLILAVAIACLPLAMLGPTLAASGLVLGAAAALWPALAARRLIGGYTGDILGAVEQAMETCFLLAISAAVRLFAA